LRAYISRNEADVPQPQATVNGHNVWARPVAEEWAEQRRRSPEGVISVMSAVRDGVEMLPALAELRDRFARVFFSALWDNPARRKRWALRWRNQEAVRDLAQGLGWHVAADVEQGGIIDFYDLAITIKHAILDEFAIGQGLYDDDGDPVFYGIAPPIGKMLGWLVRHRPSSAAHYMGEIVGDAERRLQIPREVSEHSLRTSLALDGELDDDVRREFLDRALSPRRSSRKADEETSE
jgi:hypothetical protein